jgi:Asp-tRNA(Asn)/Glu-tRNA(Gln) amidotransferase A subunit family amidase
MDYVSESVRAPRLHGRTLRTFVRLLENPLTAALLAPSLIRSLGVSKLRAAIDEAPTPSPSHGNPGSGTGTDLLPVIPVRRGTIRTIRDYADAYRLGLVTPEDVAERFLRAVAASDQNLPPLRAFIACNHEDILSQARVSAARHRANKALGLLDGVPVAVKDELDMKPYPTTVGTRFLGKVPARGDATVVRRLRDAGALLVGKTNMHEIGILPSGINPHFGTVRNPYNLSHHSGGSSSGSAAAVAAGLCPGAVGADGGGSIRIPASFCGVVGLKPTYGRISEFGAAPLCWSVAHVGPIGATVDDVALLYAAMAGRDPADPNTHGQPPVSFERYDGTLYGIRLGIYRDWFNDADPEVVATCERLIEALVRLGAEIVDVIIPDLYMTSVAFGLTILTEMAASMSIHEVQHRRDFGWTTREMLAIIRNTRPSDYVIAQRVRTRALHNFLSVLNKVSAIVTPATALTVPMIEERSLPDGVSDVDQATRTMQFASVANFTGLPAISIPAGYDSRGLPIGLQLIGRPWEEGLLFQLGFAADAIVQRRRPTTYYDMLPESRAADGEAKCGRQ